MPSTLTTEVRELLASGEPFIYAYYDGIDKVAHEYGLGEHYRAELTWVDRLIGDLLEVMPPAPCCSSPPTTARSTSATTCVRSMPTSFRSVRGQSGEGRARWLHAYDGATRDLLDAAKARYGECAWVVSREQVLDEGWFGPRVLPGAADRLGDVAARGS